MSACDARSAALKALADALEAQRIYNEEHAMPRFTEEERIIALKCLEISLAYAPSPPNADEAVEVATQFFAFVTGEARKTPRQKIDAALEAAGVS